MCHSRTKEEIIRRIQELQKQNVDLSSSNIMSNDLGLYAAAQRRFHGWYNALNAAGVPADKYRKLKLNPERKKALPPGSWTKEKIIAEIKKLAEKGEDLTHFVLLKKYPSLEAAARTRFEGSWYNALEAAGINPAPYRKQRPAGSWTKRKVIDELQELHRQGVDLREGNIRKTYPFLLTPAQKLFWGYYNALEAAGIPVDDYRKFRPEGYWTKERIINTLRGMEAAGNDLSYLSIRKTRIGSALDHATSRVFGGYYRALQAAGIDVAKYQKFRQGYWSKDKVVELLHEYVAKYGNLDLMPKRDLDLHAACYREFGSFKKAILEANLDYRSLVSKKLWTKDEIVREIRHLHQMGEDLSSSNASNLYTDLFMASRRPFGSWENALLEAGLDYRKIRKDKLMESFKGLAFEKYVRRALRILNWNTTYHRIFRSEDEGITVVPDFFDETTETWIDAKFDAGGYGVHLTIQKYLPFTDRITIIYLKGKPSRKDVKVAQFIPISNLYDELRTKGAEDLARNITKLGEGIRDPELQADFENFVYRQMRKT